MITILLILPVFGALFAMTAQKQQARGIALGFNLLTAITTLAVWRDFNTTATGLQMVERHAWIPAIGAEYVVGIDGLSLLLLLLTSLVFPFALLAQPWPRILRPHAADASRALRDVHR